MHSSIPSVSTIQNEKRFKSNTKSHSRSSPQESSSFQCLPSSIVAHIFSYTISNTRDLANLRLVSREINQSILPFILSSSTTGQLIKCCYDSNKKGGYLKELVSYETGWTCDLGEKWDLSGFEWQSDDQTSNLFRGCQIRSVLFMSKESEYDMTIPTHRTVDEHFHARLCDAMENANSLEELSRWRQEADQAGTFLPVSTHSLEVKPSRLSQDAGQAGTSMSVSKLLNIKINPDLEMICCVLLNISVPQRAEAFVSLDQEKNTLHLKCWNLSLLEDVETEIQRHLSEAPHFFPRGYKEPYIFTGFVTETKEDRYIVRLPMYVKVSFDNFFEMRSQLNVKSSFIFYSELWDHYQTNKLIREGVVIVDGIVPDTLQKTLMENIDQLASIQILDYHPNSNNIVRDLVHPSLYPYIKNYSPVLNLDKVQPCKFVGKTGATSETSNNDSESLIIASIGVERQPNNDYWGRKYEESATYQWLPTYFDVSMDGKCSICGYINNLSPRDRYPALYSSLEWLFSQILPFLESVYSYALSIKSRLRYDGDGAGMTWNPKPPINPVEERYCSLRGQRLQVVTKIVDYDLGRGQNYDGVWHVEGMSHEEIVATALYVLHRDDEITGGDILFKRAFTRDEADFLFCNVAQDRAAQLDDIIENGLLPLGTAETLQKRLIVFPNSHVHKVSTMKNIFDANGSENFGSKAVKKAKRRIIVFFLVNPEKRIISTREVPPQQVEAGGTMAYREATEHRLKLMKERKYSKDDWNVRKIELCEH